MVLNGIPARIYSRGDLMGGLAGLIARGSVEPLTHTSLVQYQSHRSPFHCSKRQGDRKLTQAVGHQYR